MKEIKAFPKRNWVIKAGIGFLIVMGLLTFFSNTILNYSLPQVTTVYSSSGAMSSSIQGTGTIQAVTQVKLMAESSRTIDRVNFYLNEEVTEGAVIATYVPSTESENEELKAAREELDNLLDQKRADDLQKPVYDYTQENRAISDAQAALNQANATAAASQGKASAAAAAQADINAAQNTIASINTEIASLETQRTSKAQTVGDAEFALASSKQVLADAIAALEAVPEGEDSTAEQAAVNAAQAAVNQNQAVYNQASAELAAIEQSISGKEAALTSAESSLSAANERLAAAQALPDPTDAAAAVVMAQRSLDDANKSLADRKKADGIQQILDAMAQEDKDKALAAAQKKVDDLTALAGVAQVVATKAGRISVLNISDGVETAKGDVMVIIDVVSDGFKVPITFTKEQAAQIQVGMGAKIADYWGSTDQDAIVVSIKPDSTDPRNNKTVTFILNDPENMYWFSTGSSISLSMNNRTVNQSCIIPLSAIHEENGETFVYTIKTKSSPLGDRYIAIKVPVTILAKDDTSAAIDPSALGEYGSMVITQSNDKSFESGDQVRLAEGM